MIIQGFYSAKKRLQYQSAGNSSWRLPVHTPLLGSAQEQTHAPELPHAFRALYLEADTAHREIIPVLQHAQVLCHQRCSVHQAHACLCVALPLGVLLCHVLQPSQPQVWRCLVAFGNPENTGQRAGVNGHFSNNKNIFIILPSG